MPPVLFMMLCSTFEHSPSVEIVFYGLLGKNKKQIVELVDVLSQAVTQKLLLRLVTCAAKFEKRFKVDDLILLLRQKASLHVIDDICSRVTCRWFVRHIVKLIPDFVQDRGFKFRSIFEALY